MSAFNIFTQPLDCRLHSQPLSDWGQELLDARLRATGRSLAAYAPVFDQAVVLIFMGYRFALLPMTLYTT